MLLDYLSDWSRGRLITGLSNVFDGLFVLAFRDADADLC